MLVAGQVLEKKEKAKGLKGGAAELERVTRLQNDALREAEKMNEERTRRKAQAIEPEPERPPAPSTANSTQRPENVPLECKMAYDKAHALLPQALCSVLLWRVLCITFLCNTFLCNAFLCITYYVLPFISHLLCSQHTLHTSHSLQHTLRFTRFHCFTLAAVPLLHA